MPAQASLAQQPVRVFVAGEFRSGKSSLINLLLRRPVIPPSFGRRRRPLLRVRFGDEHQVSAISADGTTSDLPELTDALENSSAVEVILTLPQAAYNGFEFVEATAPVGGKPDARWKAEAAAADLFVWCTIGSQAWRLTERTYIEALPREIRERAILAVTRSDMIVTDEDREKINLRLCAEADRFFSEIAFISASPRMVAGSADPSIWQSSGISRLADRIPGLSAPDFAAPPVAAGPDDGAESSNIVTLKPRLRLVQADNQPEQTEDKPASVVAETVSETTEGASAVQSQADVTTPPPVSETASDLGTAPRPAPPELKTQLAGASLDWILEPVAQLNGYRSVAIVTETGAILTRRDSAKTEILGCGLPFLAGMRTGIAANDDVGEIIIHGKNEMHVLRPFSPNGTAHLHVVIARKTSNITAARIAIEQVCALIAASD